MGQGGFGAHSEAKLVSQFMQTKFLGHKMSQNSTVLTVSSSSDCILNSLSTCEIIAKLSYFMELLSFFYFQLFGENIDGKLDNSTSRDSTKNFK